MSRTYKLTSNFRYRTYCGDGWYRTWKVIRRQFNGMDDNRWVEYEAADMCEKWLCGDREWPYFNYGKSPSSWNHDYSTVPRRANDRYLLNKIKKGELDPDDVCFRNGKKPVIYYW